MSDHRRRALAGAAAVALAVLAGCGGGDAPVEPPAGPSYDDPAEAYAAVVRAYVDDDCDTAARLVDGTAQGIEQFIGGCERREDVEVVGTLEVTGEPRETSLDPLPEGITEAVGLTAAYTDESGMDTDYYPDMVRVDSSWKLWLPGDEAPSPDASPTEEPSP